MKNVKLFISKDRHKNRKRKLVDIQKDKIYSVRHQLDEMEEENTESFEEYFERMLS